MDYDPKSIREMNPTQLAIFYPNLSATNYQVTSDQTRLYNCVAWVSHIQDENIDFSQDENGDLAQDLSTAPYIEYFETLGFQRCNDGEREEAFQKIALFEKRGEFSHVCAQLPDGHWESKLGEWEDIQHDTTSAVEGEGKYHYGKATIFMSRPW